MAEPRWLRTLRSPELGVATGVASVFLLAVGSFVLMGTREGASQHVRGEDLSAFFVHPSPWHTWLYLLFPVMALYGLSTALSTWHSVRTRWAAGQRAPGAYGSALLHLSFLAGLGAHLVGGFWGADPGHLRLDGGWADFGPGVQARLVDLEVDQPDPGAPPRAVVGTVEMRDNDGVISTDRVSYNGPLSAGLGARLWLLDQIGQTPQEAMIVATDGSCSLRVGDDCALGPRTITLNDLVVVGAGRVVASLTIDGRGPVVLREGVAQFGVTLVHVGTGQAIQLHGHEKPGNPLALVASVLALLGLAVMGARWGPGLR